MQSAGSGNGERDEGETPDPREGYRRRLALRARIVPEYLHIVRNQNGGTARFSVSMNNDEAAHT